MDATLQASLSLSLPHSALISKSKKNKSDPLASMASSSCWGRNPQGTHVASSLGGAYACSNSGAQVVAPQFVFALTTKPYPSTQLPLPKVDILSSPSNSYVSFLSLFRNLGGVMWLVFHRCFRDEERVQEHQGPCHLNLYNRDTIPSAFPSLDPETRILWSPPPPSWDLAPRFLIAQICSW